MLQAQLKKFGVGFGMGFIIKLHGELSQLEQKLLRALDAHSPLPFGLQQAIDDFQSPQGGNPFLFALAHLSQNRF